MFGRRNDAVNVSKDMDPIVLFTPLIMPTRNESMIHVTYPAEYEPMANYVKKKKAEGSIGVTFLTLMAAAYVRTAYRYPMMNCFIMGKRIYRHKDITISLIVLRDTEDGSFKEAEVKVCCEPTDTILDVAEKFEKEIAVARDPKAANGTVDVAGKLLRVPVLPSVVVALARLADRLGILPKSLNKISPFHCSLFLTNMMSIGLPSIYHHLYNFGTCSIFLSIGRPERQPVVDGGRLGRKLVIPMGLVTDERISGGAEYAQAVRKFTHYLQHPELLELTPEEEDRLENQQP